MSRHLVVVGGGVIGLSIAWHAAKQKIAVTMIDRAGIGQEASGASAGILPFVNLQTARHPLEKLSAQSHALHTHWYSELRSQTGIDFEFEVNGTIHFARRRAEKATLIGLEKHCEEEGIPWRRLTDDELRKEIPTLEPRLDDKAPTVAVKLLSDAQLCPTKLINALLTACRQLGVRVLENAGDVRLSSHGTRIDAAETQSFGRIFADDLVVAAGAWSGDLLHPLGVNLNFVPIRGQITYFKLARRPFVPCVYEGGNYLVTRHDGGLLAGSTIEDVGFDKSTTPSAIASLGRFAADFVPEVAQRKPDRVWAGLRPATHDGFPYIGRAPDFENLFVAAGHFRAGVHLAPVTATIICQLLENRPVVIDLSAFRISRG